MSIKLHRYDHNKDFTRISNFLNSNYQSDNKDGNFPEPAWQYMLFHPMLDETSLDRIGIWEENSEIVAVVHYESTLGEAFFELSPGYEYLKPEMLDYAEKNLYGQTPEGRPYVKAFINDFDKDFEALAISGGYVKRPEFTRPLTMLPVTQPFTPDISLPEGFRISSLAEDNDIPKLDTVMYRGFNHGDKPAEIDYTGRIKMQSAPGFRKKLNILVIGPDDNYLAYAGTWFNPVNIYCYVEPVCTDPDYRRMGFASKALFEGIRRCGEMGAEVAYVGSVLPVYQSMGFTHLFDCNCWIKYFD
ncbi:MAG: GNAT family N-acetyltransferase [Dehalococcoidales bacterium]|nr:GNAT family N-acetyltransferase [Dehalococcoidales bacterium]